MTRWASLLGLAARAGRVASGNEAIAAAMHRGKVSLLLVARDAGGGTIRSLRQRCRTGKVQVLLVADKEFLGRAIGRPPRAAVAVLDGRLAAAISAALEAGAPPGQTGDETTRTGVNGHGETGTNLPARTRAEH